MQSIRTPDARFSNLPDYDFEPNYVDVGSLRMHYVDEGPRDAAPVVLLHGEPSWSYLYRHMIPPIAAAGLRVVAPDLIGFGKSDKPRNKKDYSFAGHVDWMRQFIEALNLTDITLFCQDWGSLIGLRVAAENQHRFARIALGNGGLPTGDQTMPKAFRLWQLFAKYSPWFPIGKIIQKGTVTELPDDVVAAYDAPFPSSRYKAGARAFPKLVPTRPDDLHVVEEGDGFARHRTIKKVQKKKETLTEKGHKVEETEIVGYDVVELTDYGVARRTAWNEVDRIQDYAERVKRAINQANKTELVNI